MPTIRIDYDNEKVSEADMQRLSIAVRDIVSQVTQIEDVFVYANSSQIKVKVAPIELFVEISASKVPDLEDLFIRLRDPISKWRKENGFEPPINFTLKPMNWKFEIDI